MENLLFEKLIGTWKLALIEVPINGGEVTYPMGKNPRVLIIYNPDGYMSAQIMNAERNSFSQEDWTNARPEEYMEEASTYLAYSGPFRTDEEKQIVNHTMDVSLFPTGQARHKAERLFSKTDFYILKV